MEIDDEWAVHGGTGADSQQDDPVTADLPVGPGETAETTTIPEGPQEGELEADEPLPPRTPNRRQRRALAWLLRKQGRWYARAAAAMGNEPEKKLITTQVVSASTGKSQESWRLAAEAELNNFLDMSAIHESTAEERAAHGRPLPMTCVWTEAGERFKCRACVCGNFATPDPEMKFWTAQAEPSSFLASLKLGCLRGWTRSKHDVKGAFLYAGIPKDRVVIVQPPALWVRWGLVPQGVTWTLDMFTAYASHRRGGAKSATSNFEDCAGQTR